MLQLTKLSIIFLTILLISCGKSTSQTEDTDIGEELDEAVEKVREEVGGALGEESILTSSDVERYIDTMQPMSEEFSELGHDLGSEEDNTSLNELYGVPEVRNILEKYGWDDTFFQKYMSISMGFSYLKMKEQFSEMGDGQNEMLKSYEDHYLKLVHEDDIELVGEYMTELTELFENL